MKKHGVLLAVLAGVGLRHLVDRFDLPLPLLESKPFQWLLIGLAALAMAQAVMNLYDGVFRGRVDLANEWNSLSVNRRENPVAFWASLAFYALVAACLIWAFVVVMVYL